MVCSIYKLYLKFKRHLCNVVTANKLLHATIMHSRMYVNVCRMSTLYAAKREIKEENIDSQKIVYKISMHSCVKHNKDYLPAFFLTVAVMLYIYFNMFYRQSLLLFKLRMNRNIFFLK